jgi:hypothetical protein
MGGGVNEINAVLDVTGNLFMRGAGNINHDRHRFRGEFRRRGSGAQFVIRSAQFDGPVYLGLDDGNTDAPILFQGNAPNSLVFNESFGSEVSIRGTGIGNTINFHGDVFLNGNAMVDNWQGGWRFHNGNLLTRTGRTYGAGANPPGWTPANSQSGAQFLFSAAPANNRPNNAPATGWTHSPDDPMDMFTLLNISVNDPPGIDIDLGQLPQAIRTPVVRAGNIVSATYLRNLWATSPRHNGWMHLRINAGTSPVFAADDNTNFTGKAIIVITGNSAGARFFRNDNPESNVLVVIENNASVNEFGHGGTTRGLIVNRGAGNGGVGLNNIGLNLGIGAPQMTVQGAVYSVDVVEGANVIRNSPLRLQGGANANINIVHNEAILRQIMEELPGVVQVVGAEQLQSDLRVIPNNINVRGPFTELWNRWY